MAMEPKQCGGNPPGDGELLTDERLKAIEERADAATQGPWLATNPDDSSCMNMYCVSTGWEPDDETELEKPGLIAVTLLQTPSTVGGPREKWQQNADFIAHAREDVPALIRETRRLQGIINHARAAMGEKVYGCSGDEAGKTFCESYGCRTMLEFMGILAAAAAKEKA